ncbi:MAG: hypothetical protein UX04_C0007G0024 [Microgenomates group bacterium GW2011_GWF2_45_18]|nr:MAG: hypothetical protein UW18_C0002G0120 [Microgenomates group bacterium GW2011_GWF1_44_10]KKU01435.1 MAG: hypothetical protein UX04_C0007G0024 [Microgenomates group bacterium GW2011_GWF2_45_18]OGJ41511.1 MAG: hypothetical protein A2378_00510 [Candidatus Pacebacteria bacterium RIFOXYB1_FULL_44_10]HAU98849.1 hypothetical protein [Candidatus Paceibacterota bacterium]HAX01193.1 hypothetical protein [Candidatus Paceibacterota bacterium]
MNQRNGTIALLISGAIFGSFGIWIRLLHPSFGPYLIALFPNVILMIVCGIVAFYRKEKNELKDNRYVYLFVILFGIEMTAFSLAVLHTTIATALSSFYIGALVSSFSIGKIFFQEQMNFFKYGALVILFIALLFLLFPFSIDRFNLGFMFAFLAGILEASTNALRKSFSGKLGMSLVGFAMGLGGVIVSSFLIICMRDFQFQPSIFSPFYILAYGLSYIGVVYLVTYGFRYIDLNIGTILLSSELFFAVLFSFLILHENPPIQEWISGFLVVISIIFSNSSFLFSKGKPHDSL